MKSLLNVVMLLCSIHWVRSQFIRSRLQERQERMSRVQSLPEPHQNPSWKDNKLGALPHRFQRSLDDCRLRTLLLQVRDLGLGYDSEETVLFKYCSGGCPRARTNHDLTLSVLLQKSSIPALHHERIYSDPCCRPTRYEDVAFLDTSHRWHKVEKLSASACGCVG